jgi:hypothetical protein
LIEGVGELQAINRDMLAALEGMHAFTAVMFGRGPDAIIPETVNAPIGVPIKVGEIMREATAAIARAEAQKDSATMADMNETVEAANNMPERVWLLDCDPNCPGGMIFHEPHTCEGCGVEATEYRAVVALPPLRAREEIARDAPMTDAQVKHMVNRFLGWRLPENFNPDAGISFKQTFNEHTAHPMKHEPIGTNLFDATQADAMVRYMIKGTPKP